MFGGYETIEAFEDDLYRDDSSSELSVDSEVEFQLYSQVHYAQSIHNANKEEGYEEKNCENSETVSSQPNQKNLIVLSDSEVIQLSDTSEVITLSDEDSIYRCKRKNIEVQAEDKRRHHDMRKSRSPRKYRRWPRENKETQKEKTRSREGKTHRRGHQPRGEDEDFPRGSKPNASGCANNQKPSKSLHHASHYHRLREERLLRESKRSKPKKRKSTEDGSHDDLFLIKQKKKKPKPSGL